MEKVEKIVGTLKKYGVVKSVQKTKNGYEDLSDLEVIADVSDDNEDIEYKFNFVGVALVDDCVFCCYPKYIYKDSKGNLIEEPKEELKLCLDVIQKYNDTKEQLVHLYNGADNSKLFNKLAISLYLLRDYYENGLYTNQETIIETNGEGEIDWDKTINETFAILKNNKPYYVELQTINNQANELDYFKLLHERVLTECSQVLSESGLLDIFNIGEVNLSSQVRDDFGDDDYIRYRLESEIQHQFVTKKQNLLKTIYTYITECKSKENDSSFSLYGTNSFNLVWETATGEIFENVRKEPFKKLYEQNLLDGLLPRNPNEERSFCKPTDCLMDLIEKVSWAFNDNAKSILASETLEPDIISIEKGQSFKNFFILDAKYYYITHDKTMVAGQPGIQDVVKQFAYQKAYVDFINEYGFTGVANAFLVPQKSESWTGEAKDSFKNLGDASLEIMQNYYSFPLSSIQIVELNPKFVFENYLQNKKCTELFSGIKTDAVFSSRYFGYGHEPLLKVADSAKQVAGYIRPEYFDAIAKQKDPRKFLFYFYHNKDGFFYPMHPELINCKSFIGWSDDKEYYITGKIEGFLRTLSAEDVKKELSSYGFEKSNFAAKEYNCLEITDVKFLPMTDFSEIRRMIKTSPGNDALNEYSPKVI